VEKYFQGKLKEHYGKPSHDFIPPVHIFHEMRKYYCAGKVVRCCPKQGAKIYVSAVVLLVAIFSSIPSLFPWAFENQET